MTIPVPLFDGALIVSAAVAFVWCGHYFFGTVAGDPLANNVWWL